jgi:hypothetical protein
MKLNEKDKQGQVGRGEDKDKGERGRRRGKIYSIQVQDFYQTLYTKEDIKDSDSEEIIQNI